MKWLDKILGGKGVLEKVDISGLRTEEIQMKNRGERLRNELLGMETKKAKMFKEGVGADFMKKKMLAQEMQTIDKRGKQIYGEFEMLQKRLRVLTNIRMIKNRENELRRDGIWDKLLGMDYSELEMWIAKNETILIEEREKLGEMEERLGVTTEQAAEEMDKDTKELFDLWADAETGKIPMEDAEKEIELEKKLKKKETETE